MNKVYIARLNGRQEAQDRQSEKLIFLWVQTNSNLFPNTSQSLYFSFEHEDYIVESNYSYSNLF